MKFTSEDLMKAMGLSVGDIVKYNYISLVAGIERKIIAEIVNDGGMVHLKNNDNTYSYLTELVDTDYEFLPKPKRVGDTLCKGRCAECPLRTTRCKYKQDGNETLYDILDCRFDGIEDEEIYDLLKARLDKEVD